MTYLTRFTAGLAVLVLAIIAITLLPQQAPAIAGSSSILPDTTDVEEELTLLTETPEEGFQLAIQLARKGVTETQPDKEVLHALRPGYAHDADALMMASQVIAIHFQTVSAANNYWRD